LGVRWCESESGKTFLFPVPDRIADTLTADLRDWIDPDTTVISDCWSAYRDIESHGYTHQTNRTIGFVDVPTGAHTNNIQSTWRHVSLQRPTNKEKALDRKLGARTLTLTLVVLAADSRTTDSRGEHFAYTLLPKH
jgi:hypothetical protein